MGNSNLPHEAADYGLRQPRTVKDFDADDQPREKAEKHGCHVLSTADLLALILRTGLPGKPVTELTRDLMRDNSNLLHNLERRTRREIMAIKGIGLTKAIQIEAVMELIRRYCEEKVERSPIRCSKDIDHLMRHKIANLDHEEIWCVLLNRQNLVLKSLRVSSGSATASVFDVKAILKAALLENAEGLVLCHNHPSGNLRPSPQDDSITKACRDACSTMSLRLLDHLILSTQGYYSYSDEGKL